MENIDLNHREEKYGNYRSYITIKRKNVRNMIQYMLDFIVDDELLCFLDNIFSCPFIKLVILDITF